MIGALGRYTKCEILTIRSNRILRMKIDIDEQLIREAMQKGGFLTKSAAVEAGLRLLLDDRSQADIRQLDGKVKWEGNLDESRLGRNQD